MANVTLVPIRPGASGEDTQLLELEADIARKRERVAWSLAELRQRVDTATSWRHWARLYPLPWLALGFSIGLLAGSVGSSRRR
jgi:hypothetical protein